jgi:uncharacterized NAD-dependent epimerase/dehydratase family protein
VGTGSKQGKITTQLRIKNILQRAGYNVSHISTEPQGVVLGADFVFPYGHKSDVYIKQEVWSTFLDTTLRGVQEYNHPNIIITGTQSHTIPKNITLAVTPGSAFDSLCYLTGVRPDVIVCTISPDDTAEYIQRTIQTIEIFCGKVKLLFYVLSPLVGNGKDLSNYNFLSMEELNKKMNALSKILGRPVINIMDNDQNSFILNSIQDALS